MIYWYGVLGQFVEHKSILAIVY